jgi:hypothetical protein
VLGETWRDVLLAIPIERFQAEPEDAFELGYGPAVTARSDPVVVERKDFGCA